MSDTTGRRAHERARILFIDHGDVVGGAQLSLAEHLHALDRRRFEPIVACGAGAPATVYRETGAEVVLFPLLRLRTLDPRLAWRLLSTVFGLRRLARRVRPDIVVASTARAAYAAKLALWGTGFPLVWWVRDFMYERRVFSVLAPGVTRIICVSEALRRFYSGAGDQRFSVIVVGSTLHRALDSVSAGAVSAERARWGFGPDDFVIGFMGRLVEEKGVEDVIEAVATLHRDDSRARLLVVGTGNGQLNTVEERARDRVAAKGWDFIRFAGFQGNEALYYRVFDAVVLASRQHEGYGMSAVQAMMAGTPVVATAVGGTPELVRDRDTGLLVPPSAPERIAGALRELLGDSALRARLVTAARREVMTNNREEVTTARAERLYHEILAERQRGGGR
jgi:glycosyltransferase involved in cell wall biosynthesis